MPRVVKRSASQAITSGPSRRGVPLPQFVLPQLSQPVEKPPSGPQWLHEIKLDGYRMAARIDNGPCETADPHWARLDEQISKRDCRPVEHECEDRLCRWRALRRRRGRIAELRTDAGGHRRRARSAARLLRFRSLAASRLGRLETSAHRAQGAA